MRTTIDFNGGWVFHEGAAPALRSSLTPGKAVRLPHNALDLPLTYFDETSYHRPYTYQKQFDADPGWAGREVALVFDGAMADARVYLNGTEIAAHKDGYTPFSARLTGRLKPGANLITVTVDGSENPAIPPFGGAIDYLTYAGIYREVNLRITSPVSIGNPKIETPDVLAPLKTIVITTDIVNVERPLAGTLRAQIKDAAGKVRGMATANVDRSPLTFRVAGLNGIELWDTTNPVLYTLELTLDSPAGVDTISIPFGFRQVEFTAEGFKLNGNPLKLRGLNRHQSFPYIGYALGKAAQRRDAEILKNELHLNMVRTSHYPQSTHFLDRCDQLGLLVFEEIPGWQHIGDAAWKTEATENVRRMIRRDWNHPSIVIWGVRINESSDDHDFYVETNRVAHELDSTRPTGGVRFITDSEFLEDVYTMNDFFLGNEELGGNRPRTPLRPQQEVTGRDDVVPYMITEYAGHMYPTKSFDQEQRQAEHVLRHLQVMNAAYGDPQIAGAIGWCAFDYNTHRDFGSGDRICHHGVMDMFREPKLAAYAYASQCEPAEQIVLEPVTFWTRGDRNIGGVMPLMVLTNCDEVQLSHAGGASKLIAPDRETFPNLPHPPVVFDQRNFTSQELVLWGMPWPDATITGFIAGKPVKQVALSGAPVATTLQVVPDTAQLATHDEVRVVVRALDQGGRKLPFFFDPVAIEIEGPAKLLGPSVVPLRAGSTGFWVRATGPGPITIRVSQARLGTTAIALTAV